MRTAEDRRALRVVALAMAAILTFSASSCGGSEAAPDELPGAGESVTMGRADWSTGYFQAEVVRLIVEELGYTVNDPALMEMSPDEFYPLLARGKADFWANGWFPSHGPLMEAALSDGSLVGDHVAPVGFAVAGGGLQGVLVDAATAEAASVVWLGDIGNSPEIAALFDLDDNGRADIVGCDDGWGCHGLLDDLIEQHGWSDTLEQMSDNYEQLWDGAVTRLSAGEPVLAYTWSPSGYLGEMTPGDTAVWLSVAEPESEQVNGVGVALPANECPGQPCDLGFAVADIRIVAGEQFLSSNPVLARLFAVIGFQLSDIVLQNYQMQRGEDSPADVQRHAAEWIEAERRTVDAWLREARSAAG